MSKVTRLFKIVQKFIPKCDSFTKLINYGAVFTKCLDSHKRNLNPDLNSQNLLYLRLLFLFLSLTMSVKNLKKMHILPFVEVSDLNVSSHRKNFNYISEVVKETLPSVVYVAVIDSERKHVVTGKPIIRSSGSGFVVRSDGLILTSGHVVNQQRQTKLIVKLFDGTIYPALVEHVDSKHDIAVVKIIGQVKLKPMKMLRSARDLRCGEWVVAMGSPISLINTVTCGIVSNVDRSSQDLGLSNDSDPFSTYFIQTDAPINYGNSGGPLVNLNSEVVGINSLKVTTGISFAVPIHYAKDFLNASFDVKTSPITNKRYFGITSLSLNLDIIQELQQEDDPIPFEVTFGVLILKVFNKSPAELAGLQSGDIITYINDIPVQNADVLFKIMEASTYSKIAIVRGNEHLYLTVSSKDLLL